tara:strand:- start:18775 stop:20004 length:1230 start_codon:yes stop_codon:yes gene_type:complete
MDMARGFAVMGIVLMNIIAFSMPEAAYFNPDAWGGQTLPDRIVWAISFILVDGKMRALFSLLFGASMLLLMDRTEMAGGNGQHRHIVRCFWLALIGLAHYLLLWWGDILMLYAVVGLLAMHFAGKQPLALVKCAFLAFAVHFVIISLLMLSVYSTQRAAAAPDASRADITHAAHMLDSMGRPGSDAIDREIDLYRGDWSGMVDEKAAEFVGWSLSGLQYMGLDTLGFMLLGMAMLKSGFLTGAWSREQYLGTARHCFLIAIPPMATLAVWAWSSGFDTVTTFGAVFAWSFPFRIPMTVGFAAIILAAVTRGEPGAFLLCVEAAGRMSLSNYLGTSLLMTALFYGWGLSLFASVPRAQVYLVIPCLWALMLLWSRPWLTHFRYGPAEWLWRSLTLGRPQPLRRLSEISRA